MTVEEAVYMRWANKSDSRQNAFIAGWLLKKRPLAHDARISARKAFIFIDSATAPRTTPAPETSLARSAEHVGVDAIARQIERRHLGYIRAE